MTIKQQYTLMLIFFIFIMHTFGICDLETITYKQLKETTIMTPKLIVGSEFVKW